MKNETAPVASSLSDTDKVKVTEYQKPNKDSSGAPNKIFFSNTWMLNEKKMNAVPVRNALWASNNV